MITLPAGLYSNTGIPVALWILRPSTTTSPRQVLLLDASQLGSRKRLQVELSELDIQQIVECRSAWENSHALPQADNLPCVAVSSERLLQGDCQLLVQYWQAVTADPKKQITRVRNASTGLREAITSLSVPKPLGLLQASPAPSRTLQELIDSGHAELIRGIRVPLELISKGSTPIIGLGDFHDDWRVTPSTTADLVDFDRDIPISQPGDVLIAAEGKKIFTAVAVKGGAVVTAPLQCLRLREQSMDRSLVLAVLLPETLGQRSGSPSYADIRNLEVPWPNNEQCARVVGVLRAVVTQRRAAQAVAKAADELVNSTVDALMAGALPVDNRTESVVTPR